MQKIEASLIILEAKVTNMCLNSIKNLFNNFSLYLKLASIPNQDQAQDGLEKGQFETESHGIALSS